MKKTLIALLICFCMTAMMGCSQQYIVLSETESDALAEISAYLLLKYDKNYRAKLLDHSDLERAKELLAEQAAFDELRKNVKDSITKLPKEDDKSEQSVDSDVPETTTAEGGEHKEDEYADSISDVLGLKHFSVSYDGYSVCDSYDGDNEYFSIDAPQGKKIIVAGFKIKNISKKTRTFSGTELKAGYSIITENDKRLEPKISLLNNDIQFYNKSLEANQEDHAVLLFFTDEEITSENMILRITKGNNGKVYDIDLK